MQVISAGLLEFATIIQIPYAASIGMSWERFLKLLTMMQRQLGASQTMTHYSQFDQLLTQTHHKISGQQKPDEQLTIDEAISPFRRNIFFCI